VAAVRDGAGYADESPVAALATSPAISALSLIRVSGAGSLELLAKVFSRPQALLSAAGHTVVYGWITVPPRIEAERNGGGGSGASGAAEAAEVPRAGGGAGRPAKKIDEVLVSVYRAPRSYTGEDGADISCHGGFQAGKSVLEALFRAGFRPALPGEFTFRAFVNGKLDLTRAESVMEIVGARGEAGLDAAAARLSGALEGRINEAKEMVVRALAEVELNLDYSELDGIGDESPDGALPGGEFAEAALGSLEELAETYSYQKLCRDGATVVLAGKPNAGKSSLFNCLVNEERSIVSPVPGTTRDWIEAWVSAGGIPVRLIDTAGLRDLPYRVGDGGPDEAAGNIEKSGIERTQRLLKEADLILAVFDGAAFEKDAGIPAGKPQIPVWNKSDIAPCPENSAFLPVSAKTGAGIPALMARIKTVLEEIYQKPSAPAGDAYGAGIGTERQKELTEGALLALKKALELAGRGEALDIIAVFLREAAENLGRITGEVSADDILEEMFSRFCVGK